MAVRSAIAVSIVLLSTAARATHIAALPDCTVDDCDGNGDARICFCPNWNGGFLSSYKGCLAASNLIPGRPRNMGIGLSSRRDHHDEVFVAEDFANERLRAFPEDVQFRRRYEMDFPGKYVTSGDDSPESRCDAVQPRFVPSTTLCTFAGCFLSARGHGDGSRKWSTLKPKNAEDLFVGLREAIVVGGSFGTGRTLPPEEALHAMADMEAGDGIRMTNIMRGSRWEIRGRPQHCRRSDVAQCLPMLVGDDAMVDSAATEMCRRIFYTDLVSVSDNRAEPRVRSGFVKLGRWEPDDRSVPNAGWSNLTGPVTLLTACNPGANGTVAFASCIFQNQTLDPRSDVQPSQRRILVCELNSASSRALWLVSAVAVLAMLLV